MIKIFMEGEGEGMVDGEGVAVKDAWSGMVGGGSLKDPIKTSQNGGWVKQKFS